MASANFGKYHKHSKPLMVGLDIARIIMGMDVDEVRSCYKRYSMLLNTTMDADSFGMTFDQFAFVFGMKSMDELHAHTHEQMPKVMHNPHFKHYAEEVEGEELGPTALFNKLKNESNRVDVFETFAGVAILCSASLMEKINLMFEIFDFDHMGELAEDELSYMVVCVCSALSKLHLWGMPTDEEIRHLSQSAFMNEQGFTRDGMSLSLFTKWVLDNPKPLEVLETIACIPRMDLCVKMLQEKVDAFEQKLKFENHESLMHQMEVKKVAHIRILLGPIIGRVTADTAVVLIEITHPALVMCEVFEFDGKSKPSEFRVTKVAPVALCMLQMSGRNPAPFVLKDLKPNTRYIVIYRGVNDNDCHQYRGTFKTFREHRRCPFSGKLYQDWPRHDKEQLLKNTYEWTQSRQLSTYKEVLGVDYWKKAKLDGSVFIKNMSSASFCNEATKDRVHGAFKRVVAQFTGTDPKSVEIVGLANKPVVIGRRRKGCYGVLIKFSIGFPRQKPVVFRRASAAHAHHMAHIHTAPAQHNSMAGGASMSFDKLEELAESAGAITVGQRRGSSVDTENILKREDSRKQLEKIGGGGKKKHMASPSGFGRRLGGGGGGKTKEGTAFGVATKPAKGKGLLSKFKRAGKQVQSVVHVNRAANLNSPGLHSPNLRWQIAKSQAPPGLAARLAKSKKGVNEPSRRRGSVHRDNRQGTIGMVSTYSKVNEETMAAATSLLAEDAMRGEHALSPERKIFGSSTNERGKPPSPIKMGVPEVRCRAGIYVSLCMRVYCRAGIYVSLCMRVYCRAGVYVSLCMRVYSLVCAPIL
jgi:hypothetical protein